MTDRVIIAATAALLGAGCWGGARDQDNGRSGAVHAMTERAAEQELRDRGGAYREFTIAAGTPLRVALASRISSDRSQAEDRVRGVLREPVRVGGISVLPQGALLEGSVVQVERAGSAKGRANVAFRFTRVAVYGETHLIDATRLAYSAEPTRQDEALKVGMPRAAGAGPWRRQGSAAGPGTAPVAATHVVLATRGDDVTLPPGTVVTIRLNAPLTVRMALN